MKRIIIIGGGASGLMAAISASFASKGRVEIVICERLARVGKKILATGNGRCNYTNRNVSEENYFGEKPAFVKPALELFDVDRTVDFFFSLGVFPKEEKDGKLYPYCEQASAVLDCLRLEAEKCGIIIKTGFDVKSLKPTDKGFKVLSYKGEELSGDRVILACGGCASPDLGSNGSGFKLLKELGHRITDLSPALVQLRLKADFLKSLSGIKIKGKAGLETDNHLIREEEGEILFTDYGISGPPVFQLSAYFPKQGKTQVSIDFMPEYETAQVFGLLRMRAKSLNTLTMESFFTGLLNKRIGNVICRKAGIEKLSFPVKSLTRDLIWALAYEMKFFKIEVLGANGWNNAQATAGGASVREFHSESLESKKIKGLYCCGEILDIFGQCGGYNLQWAWSSGWLAGAKACEGMV
ncbi:MAG: NAD(P)/FAD-dependent oxidoreductase [Clostridiales bacterium]|nr:NAD(P)/FAD-dependent oxidoreductase [Clostridiales bacterium]